MIHVDFDTQTRTPKLSAKVYAKLISHGKASDADCD
jgi:beta-glucosidase/6-phospho-beta-glucosidase/beta-galactosidase